VILHINGRLFGQPTTGVQRYGRELIGALDALFAKRGVPTPFTGVRLHVPAKPRARIPILKVVQVITYGVAGSHAWEQFELPFRARAGVLFCPGNVAPISLLLGRMPVVVTIHDLSFRYFPAAYRWRYRWLYHLLTPLIIRRAARIITVSQSERDAIAQVYPMATKRLVAIQNGGAPAISLLTDHPPPADAPYILYVGSLSKRKNLLGVLGAFHRLAGERPTLRLVVVGGVAPSLAGRHPSVSENEHRGRITYLGQVEDRATLEAAYKGASCFVFPSFYEASPLPPIEAMAHSCPVVAADIPSLRERCGPAALYCDPHDPESIAGAVTRVLDGPALAEELRAAGIRQAERFSWESCADRTLEALTEVAQQLSSSR